MKKLWVLIVLAWASLVFAAPKTVTFATEATYPPFEFLDASGKIQGFDIEIANALCQKMQVKCVIVNQAFDSLIPALQLGKIDAVIAAMNITPERQKQVDFTTPYYLNTASVVASKRSHLTLDNLKGKVIGVQSGTTFGPYLQNKYGTQIKVQTYASEESAFLDLVSGRIDAVMGDTPLVKLWLQKHADQYEIVGQPVDDKNYFGQGYGIAVKKGNQDLLQQLNKAIAAIKADGSYQKILVKYE